MQDTREINIMLGALFFVLFGLAFVFNGGVTALMEKSCGNTTNDSYAVYFTNCVPVDAEIPNTIM